MYAAALLQASSKVCDRVSSPKMRPSGAGAVFGGSESGSAYLAISTKKERCVIGAVCDGKWDEWLADRPQSLNRGGGDRPRPFVIIAIWAGSVLTENRGGTVTRAQVSKGICVMHTCWGL